MACCQLVDHADHIIVVGIGLPYRPALECVQPDLLEIEAALVSIQCLGFGGIFFVHAIEEAVEVKILGDSRFLTFD
jgi:hypothetical protein